MRSDFERARDEENRKIDNLEQVRKAMQLAREEDQRKLAELQSINSRYAADREADSRKINDLERRLAGLEDESMQGRERVQALQDALSETESRMEQTDQQIEDLQLSTAEQARQFRASLSEANDRLFATGNQVNVLGSRLESEHRLVLKTFETLQDRLRKQDVRMNWMITAASFAILLGTVAGAVLIWDIQKNATLLAGMSRDIKDLTSSVNQSGMQKAPVTAQPPLALPARAPRTGTKQTVNPAGKPAATFETVPPAKATLSKAESNPFFLGSALERARSSSRLGVQQATRQDANAFFAENARVEGMISLGSGVQYRVVKFGNGKSPSLADQVVVAYVGIKPDGAVFDESYSTGAPSTFSMTEVLPGWQEVLLKMQEGAEFELYVPPKLATSGGTRKRSMLGFEPSIYLIELLQVVKNGATAPSAPVK